MKKLLCIALVLALTLCTFVPPVKAEQEDTLPEKCEHCGVAVTWMPLTREEVRDTTSLNTGHYYIAMEEDSYDCVAKKILADQQVCLYLNGKTLAGTTRGLNIVAGATLNIMGDGKITGRGTTAGVNGACCVIEEGGTLNQYGGTLSYVTYKQRHAINGGVVYVEGTYNLYDGIVENGVTKQNHGGNIYVGATGEFNMYGGTVRNGSAEYAGGNMYVHATGIFRHMGGSISGGTAKVAGNCVYNRGTMLLSGNACCDSVFLNTNTANGGPALADMVVIDGDFSGDVTIELTSATAGADIGNTEGGVISGNLRILGAMLSGQIVDGNIILVSSGYCDHCKKTVVWEPLSAEGSSLPAGHYYAEGDIATLEQKYIYVDRTVCINLNGKTVKSETRPFTVYPGGTLNIMGGGTLVGCGSAEKYANGAAVNITEDGTVNLYSGTLSYEASEDTAIKAQNGGVVNIAGNFNMYGGTITGGVATNAGGSVFVEPTGVFAISGGTVEMGKMGTAGSNSCIYNRGTVILSGVPVIAQLLQKPKTEDGGPSLGDMLVIRDTFNGQVDVRISGLAVGVDAGNLENADFSNAAIKINGSTVWSFVPMGNDLLSTQGNSVILFAADGTKTGYSCLADAADAANGTADRIVLFAPVAEAVDITKDILLDLNGFAVTGSLNGGKTVYIADAMTDDYTVADGIYGNIAPGSCTFLPAEGYVLVKEDGKVTSHKLSFNVTAMSLRQQEAGLYFTAEFAGDEVVASQIQSFGVALNATEAPGEDNMQTSSLYTAYSTEKWRYGETAIATGTMLSGIMKTGNDTATNMSNAGTTVYGSAYIQTAKGYRFGSTVTVNLQSFLERSDEAWSGMNSLQKKNTLAMYDTFAAVMDGWKLPNLKTEKAEAERYASVEKTATQTDIAQLDDHYRGLEAYHGELHDHAATGGRSDGKQPLEVWVAYMEHLDMDFAAIVDHKQVRHMYLPEWQNGMFIGGTEAATTVKELQMSMHYNMMFTDPEALIEILEGFPEFKYTGGDPLAAYFPYYPSFDRARITELIAAIREKGGMFTQVHPTAGSYINSDDPLDYWFADWTGLEVVSTYHTTRDDERTAKNYKLWVDLLALGKKVWATAGNDEHNMPTVKSLSTVYASAPNATAYFDKVRVGNFTVGPVGIQMCIGDTVMGSECSFAGQRVVFSVGDFHSSVYDPDHTYRVDLISSEGIVFSQEVSCLETTYFAVDAADVDFYRVEVWDTTLNSRLSIGNPIWNVR